MMKDDNTLNISVEMVDSISDVVNDSMTFGDAIEAMKHGKRVARKGWNGKGMYIYITEGYRINLDSLPVAGILTNPSCEPVLLSISVVLLIDGLLLSSL